MTTLCLCSPECRAQALRDAAPDLADALEAALRYEDAAATEMEAMGYTPPELPWKEQACTALRKAGRQPQP